MLRGTKRQERSIIALILLFAIILNIHGEIDLVYAERYDALAIADITVEGFQIKMIESMDGVCFRTICRAPDVGSSLYAEGNKYTVIGLGIIYSKDPNISGMNKDNVLDKSFTEVNKIPFDHRDKEYKYIGQKLYDEQNVTFGYIATDKGVVTKENGYTTYVMTMKNMDDYMMNTIRVRAFVEVVDGNGNIGVVYGQYASLMSVAEIAHKIYADSKAPSEKAHKYIFDKILSNISNDNPYYRNKEEEYGWGGSIEM